MPSDVQQPDDVAGLAGGAGAAVRHRILQADGRRYSIKIEEVYWRFLEVLADQRGLRLSRLVREIAAHATDESSLAASLRLFCLNAAALDLDRLKRQVRERASGDNQSRLLSVIDANPTATLLIGHDRLIRRANGALSRWSGTAAGALLGKPFDWFFQVRANPPLPEVFKHFAGGGADTFAARISYVAPGRIVVANAQLCLALHQGPEDFAWILLVEQAARPSKPQSPPPAKSA